MEKIAIHREAAPDRSYEMMKVLLARASQRLCHSTKKALESAYLAQVSKSSRRSLQKDCAMTWFQEPAAIIGKQFRCLSTKVRRS